MTGILATTPADGGAPTVVVAAVVIIAVALAGILVAISVLDEHGFRRKGRRR